MRPLVKGAWKKITMLLSLTVLLLGMGVSTALAAEEEDEGITVVLHTGTNVAQIDDEIDYVIEIRNRSGGSLRNIVLDAPSLGLENYDVPDIAAGLDWALPGMASYRVEASDLPGPLNVSLNATGTVDRGEFGTNDIDIDVTESVDLVALRFTKTADPIEIELGEEVDYTLRVENIGSIPLDNVWVRDPALNGFFANLGTVDPGSTRTLTPPPYTPLDSDFAGGSFINVATVTGEYIEFELDVKEIILEAEATVTLRETPPPPSRRTGRTPRVDLAVEKTVDDRTPDEGQTVRFTVTVTNEGPDDADGVQLTDLLPAGLLYAGHDASQGTYDEVSGEWVVGRLAYEESATLTLRAVVETGTAGRTLTNTAWLSNSNPTDRNADNDRASASVTPSVPPVVPEPEPVEPEDDPTPPAEPVSEPSPEPEPKEDPSPQPLPVTGGSAAVWVIPGALMLGAGMFLRRRLH